MEEIDTTQVPAIVSFMALVHVPTPDRIIVFIIFKINLQSLIYNTVC